MHTKSNFVLHGGDTAFANRQKALFDQLLIAEKQCSKDTTSPGEMDVEVNEVGRNQQSARSGQKRKSETKRFRGKESIFKRPEGPAPRSNFRSIPDHHRNPHKWMKYSLEDVSKEDMTEQSNARAAFSFLRELKARKGKQQPEAESEKMEIDETESSTERTNDTKFKARGVKSSTKVQFRKPEADKQPSSACQIVIDTEEKPIFRSSKIIMPEYVVGQKQHKKVNKQRSTSKVDRTKELRLDHLQEIDEDED